MQWFEEKPIEVTEREDGLFIRATGVKHWLVVAIVVALIIGFSIDVWLHKSWFSFACLLFCAFVGVALWLADMRVELLVTEKDLESFNWSWGERQNHVRIRWSAISGLEYQAGDEDSSSGLYARTGGRVGICIMPNLNERQVDEVIAAILTRFPCPEMSDDIDNGWSLFGNKSELTTLGLSKPKD